MAEYADGPPREFVRCVDCGKPRWVLPQHAQTVKRCVEHQTKHRQRHRNEMAKRRRRGGV